MADRGWQVRQRNRGTGGSKLRIVRDGKHKDGYGIEGKKMVHNQANRTGQKGNH